ncbi:unnamed protein product [Agarophyton chilense]
MARYAYLTAIVLLLCVAVAAHEPAAAVLELSFLSLDHLIKSSSKPLLLQFYSPTCGHCVRFEPAYERIARQLHMDANVARVDGVAHRALRLRFRVMAFPSFFLIHAGSVFEFVGSRSVEELIKFTQSNGTTSGEKVTAINGPLNPYWQLVHLLFRFVNFLQVEFKQYCRNGGNIPLLVFAVVTGVMCAFVVAIYLITLPPKPYPSRNQWPVPTHAHHD